MKNKSLRIVQFELLFCRECFFSNHVTFLNPISNILCNFLLQLNMANGTLFALFALFVLKQRKNKLAQNKIRFDL